MQKYINEYGKECYRGITEDSNFWPELFHKPEHQYESDEQFALHTNLGSLTVLDRLTGYEGYVRDVESGFRDMDGNFWLATGGVDVRQSGVTTVGEAIAYVKRHANTCIGI